MTYDTVKFERDRSSATSESRHEDVRYGAGKAFGVARQGCVRLAGWPARGTLMIQSATELKDEWWFCVSQFPMQSLPSDDCVDDASSCADGRSQPFPVREQDRGARSKHDDGKHVERRHAVQGAAKQPPVRGLLSLHHRMTVPRSGHDL